MPNVNSKSDRNERRTAACRELSLDVEVSEDRIAPAFLGTGILSPENAFSGSTASEPILECQRGHGGEIETL